MMTITKLNILKKTKKYVFKTILKTAFKTCYNEVKSPRLKISDPPKVLPYFTHCFRRPEIKGRNPENSGQTRRVGNL